jgi:hypothetical protein
VKLRRVGPPGDNRWEVVVELGDTIPDVGPKMDTVSPGRNGRLCRELCRTAENGATVTGMADGQLSLTSAPPLIVAWVVAKAPITVGDAQVADAFHCSRVHALEALEWGVETGQLRYVGSYYGQERFAREDDPEAAFWREMDYRDRHGLL